MALVEIKQSDSRERLIQKLNSNFASLRRKPDAQANTIVIEQTSNAVKAYVDDSVNIAAMAISNAMGASLTKQDEKLEQQDKRIEQLFDLMYPVGSVIVTASAADSRLDLGTWIELKNTVIFDSIVDTQLGTSQTLYIKKTVSNDDKADYLSVTSLNYLVYQRTE